MDQPSSSSNLIMEQTFTSYAHNSNEESVIPGRRTPLSTVGLGGFYFPSGSANLNAHCSTDENSPESSQTNK